MNLFLDLVIVPVVFISLLLKLKYKINIQQIETVLQGEGVDEWIYWFLNAFKITEIAI